MNYNGWWNVTQPVHKILVAAGGENACEKLSVKMVLGYCDHI